MKGIYIVGGYPDMNTFRECFHAVSGAGFDFIEIGIPFNDPTADGPAIAAAQVEMALKVTAEDVARELKALKDIAIHKYLMTYSNIIYSHGIKKFADLFRGLVRGIIVADLPNRMQHIFYDKGLDIPIIPFVTLESRESDIKTAAQSGADFIYFIGLRGITGSKADMESNEMKEKIAMIRKFSDKKIVIGFGIKTGDDAARALALGDGYVVGTEAVKRQKDIVEFRRYLGSLGAMRN